MRNIWSILSTILIAFLCLISCDSEPETAEQAPPPEPTELASPDISFIPTGKINRKDTQLFTLTNGRGMKVKVSTYGGIITSILAPDKDGNFEDIVLGFDTLSKYSREHPYFGAIIGRYGNRIAGGKFTLNGKTYQLATNDGQNHLHGGDKGFDKVAWGAVLVEKNGERGLQLKYVSPDGEEGYPGKLEVLVTYFLNNDNELKIEYQAKTDQPTIVNLTNHTYFNLTGNTRRDILNHTLLINAQEYLPVNDNLIPTGELRRVRGTPFDFTEPTRIGDRIDADDEQIRYGGGYDHCWVLNSRSGRGLTLAARLREPTSGRMLEVHTTEPGMQFYSGNFLDGSLIGKGGVVYDRRYGLCLETQHFPDSPNQPDFPTTVLEPGKTYRSQTVYKFGLVGEEEAQ